MSGMLQLVVVQSEPKRGSVGSDVIERRTF